jgi:hypothetical protein
MIKHWSDPGVICKRKMSMSTNKDMLTLVGFLLMSLGFLALVLSLVGVQFAFLTWIDTPGRLVGFIIRLLMIVAGIVMIYFGRTDLEKEEI